MYIQEGQHKAANAFTKRMPRITEDTKAINRYVENNEKIIDKFIRERIKAGDFAEIYNPVAERHPDIRFPDRKKPNWYFGDFLTYAQVDLEKFLNIFNISVFNAFNKKKIVFIKVPRGVSYPVINENVRSITVKSHTSENSVYFFLDSDSFEQIKKTYDPLIYSNTGFEKYQYKQIISAISLETVVHEIGVSYGLPYEVTPGGKIVNDLDKAFTQYFSGSGYIWSLRLGNEISAQFPRLKNLAQANLDHVKGRDYAAGDTKAAPQKGAVNPAYVYFFGNGETSAEGLFKKNLDERKIILGGKGEGLHSMTRAKIPVPPGFTITTDACNYYYTHDQNWPNGLKEEVNSNLAGLEKLLNKKLGDNENPLLVSVRSGAKFSMPGMMDTILNLGLNDTTVLVFAHKTGNERLAWDSYRRFIQMFSDVVLGIEKKDFEKIIESKKEELSVKDDVELNAEDLKDLVAKFKALVASRGKEFPQDVRQQLIMAVNAVFESWNNPRAITYRNLNKIPHDLGTAVNVQAMVFGNTGNRSATGVGFTRNPSTGVKEPYGEFLLNAQGEDVVAGTRTPQGVSQLKEAMPEVYSQLMKITDGLEKHYKDMQDFEFTIEDGKLYLLQTRSGKRTGVAAVKVAVDMVKEGLITKEEALMRVEPKQLNEVLFPILDPQAKKSLTSKEILATGLSAGPGAAAGQIVFTAEDAVKWTNDGKQVILWRKETCPDDIAGMDKAIGVGTSIGGMTSHAALVARGMGKVTMVGAGQVDVSYEKKEAYAKNELGEVIHTLKEGDWITLNVVEKEKAQLILGKKDIVRPEAIGVELGEFLSWAKEASRLRVWANADIPHDARKAFSFGAEGIGLCRTEHMFFEEDRLPIMQEMILADSTEARKSALDKLLPMQREDFIGLFREMKGYPVTIRTLDPPLHEFLPKREELMVEIKELELTKADPDLIKEKKKLLSRINELHEFNPMMGMRGTRLGIMMPEITAMQARAIAEAAVAVIKEGGKVVPEIMIPLVGKSEEFTHQKKIVIDAVEKVMKESGVSFQYRIGTMIEVPRGALTADELAKEAEFFSFGTNDLTQYGAGFSRDDIGKLMSHYLSLGIYSFDPFETFDAKGIGELVRIAVEKGRKTKPGLKIGVCGEHGGDPESIKFFHEAGLNYVSCSPYRVLGAWLAAAQAALKEKLSKSPALPAKEAARQSETNIIEKFADAISRVINVLKENSPGIEKIVFRNDMQQGLVMEFYTPHGIDSIYSKEKQDLPYQYKNLQLSFSLFEDFSNRGLIDKFTIEIKQSKEEIAKNLEDAVKEKLSKGPAVETESDGGLNSRVNESQTPAQAAKAPLSVSGGKAQSSEADTSPILTIKQEPQAMQWGDVGIHTITGAKNGSFIAIGGGKQYVDIVDSKTWRTIRRLKFSDWGIWAIDSSPEFLAIGGTTAELRIYRTADLINYHDKPDLLPLTTIQIEYKDLKIEKINAIRFLGGEKQQYLAVGYKAREGYKNGIAILGKTVAQWEIIGRFEDYNGENNSLDSSGELFAYGTKEGVTIRKIGSWWGKYKDISLVAEEGDLIAPVRFLSNGKYIIGGTSGGEVILWDTAGTFWLRNRYINGKIRSLVPSPDGRRLLITSGSHEDLSKSSDIIIANIGGKIFDTFGDRIAETKGHNDIVYGALWLDNETFITAAGYFDKHLRKWKIAETPLSPPAAGQSDAAKSAPAAFNATILQRKAYTAIVNGWQARRVFDSRGKPTVEAVLKSGICESLGDVPAGASKGKDEAQTVDVDQAIKNINEIIAPMLMKSGLDLSKHEDLVKMEKMIIEAAGENFKILGANAAVPVSRALWNMAAKLHGMELDEYIRAYEPDAVSDNLGIVRFYMNIYNGGLHALKKGEELGKDRIDIQEIMIVPVSNKTHQEGLDMGDKTDFNLKKILSENNEADKITRADEAGFSVKGLGSSEQAIEHVFQAVERAGYKAGEDIKLALDVAASSFYDEEKGTYRFQGKDLTSGEMVDFYVRIVQKYKGKIISIEDGLAENDWAGWKKLTKEMKKFGIRTIGDDIFVTQLPRLEKSIAKESATDILIKVNQNGTIYGTLEVIKRAKQAGIGWVVSHRSGETLDASIADIAYATKAKGLKTGDPQPDYDFGKGGQYEGKPLVRRAKYLRMVEIEKRVAAAESAEEATPAEAQNIKKLGGLFDKKLIAEDTTVIQEIVDYYNALANPDDRQSFYEWLQHHESALAAEAIAKVGLNWEGVIQKLVSIIDGNIDGNRRAAVRQLNELATQSTYGGLKASDKITADALIALKRLSETVSDLIQPVAFPEAPKIPNGVQPGVLVLTRHGETSWSEAVFNKWAGWHDSKVTEKGQREALDSGRQLSGINLRFDVGYTSDLSRAQVTMQKFLEGFGQPDLPISSYWELRERNYGDLIGWRRAIVEKVFGKDQYNKWRRGYEGNDVRPPGGENLRDVMERSIPCFVENILKDIANGKNVPVSAHGNSLRSILVNLRERTTGKTLTEEEVMKLEVPLSTPIIVTFDRNLRHKELWVKDGIGPKGITDFLTSNRSEVSLEQEIAAMTPLASEAGKLLAPPAERYNLLVTWEFFANGELQEHRARYADRFDIDTVSGISFKQFVDNIIAKAAGKETKTIVLVPNDLSAGQLERLTKAGIRFIRVDNIGLLQAAMNKDPGREKFQIDTYAAMLLLRRIDGSITADSSMYRLLSFYLKSHFALTERIAIDDYIMAVINNDIAKLIKGYLSYRPAQPYDVPDYNKVAASLISA